MSTRSARVRALAKVNLDLRVLGKRPDGYHELRTILQTISLADTMEIAFTPSSRIAVDLACALDIPDNLVARAARLVLEALRKTGHVQMRLKKRIPMGAGLGGGSSDAAAVLLALPALAGKSLGTERLLDLAQQLGSDVPFFLLGGAAVGIGRGTELFPLDDSQPRQGVVVATGVHVSTPEAYRRLSPRLTTESQQNKIFSFQSQVWNRGLARQPPGARRSAGTRLRASDAANDFEDVVFEEHRRIAAIKRDLLRQGAETAMMTGSGSAVFGLFPTGGDASRALESLGNTEAFRISLVGRAHYRSMWWHALREHITGRIWPPRSRYAG
ncbi:MAG TPA: 4-(cytidine 5'-diphospho)-2-C-methyl-D-erythritol kinase [Bryobacteraceae bacterium]|nr:4-(cytidine 5'-diphospho)-2-C-methyl-D-erythritol kinase [Bryobacteraceae bacterium]